MRILRLDGGPTVVIVGHGQLGSAITAAITGRSHADDRSYPTDWSNAAAAARSTETGLEQDPISDRPVVVWAAGRCGMSSTASECDDALSAAAGVLRVLADLRPRATHVLGSVGALALGHPRWSPRSAPVHPEVPYARLKKDEERLVAGLQLGDAVFHRVSSVYGPPERPGRRGMITTLAVNAAQLRTTRIYGDWSTLRNYVHADDVGAFVAAKVLRHTGPGSHVLAAHRSHAIGELVRAVGVARRRPVPVRLVPSENADDLTIDPGAIDPAFRTRPLDTAIRQLVLDLRHVPVG